MTRLGDAPTDMLFGLIALHNDLVAPAVIPAALKAQEAQPGRTLADTLVAQGALSPAQRELVESLYGECLKRNGGDTRKTFDTLVASPSAQQRLDQLGNLDETKVITADGTFGTTVEVDGRGSSRDLGFTLEPSIDPTLDGRTFIAGHEIWGVLGVGGMGVVYKARQPRLDRFVALKMIRGGSSARPEDIARFESEAKAVAAIEHTNFVKIHEIGEHEGLPFFSLEYLPGGSLAQKIGGKPQPFDEAASIVETLARAMYVAHEHKVIHRDLKPTNVLFAADGTLKITDFGLVKRLEGDSSQTRSGSILGTPSYMAPEQARGESQKVGPAADQYALGAILYELLTGHPPFQGTSVLDTLDMVRNKEPVPPSQLQPKTPRDLETICLKCLEKDIARRYADTHALAEDLRKFQAGETILARPVSEVERLGRWCMRNKKFAGLIGAVVSLILVGVVGLAIATLMFGQKNLALAKANALAQEQRQEAENKERVAVAAARAANEQNRIAVDSQVEMIVLLMRKLRFVPAIQNEREQLLDTASKRLEGAAQAMANLRRDVDWAAEDEEHNWRSLARAHQAQGSLSLDRNQIPNALAQFRQAEEINTRIAAADPNNLDLQVNLIRSKRQLGYVTMEQIGDSEAAQKYLNKAIELSRACLAKKPDSDTYKSELANSIGGLAKSELRLGHLEKARELYEQESTIRDSFSPEFAAGWESRRELTGLFAQLADRYVRIGNLDEARRLYDRLFELRTKIAAERPDSWPAKNDLALAFNHLGTMQFPLSNAPGPARKFYHRALELFRERAKADPSDSHNKRMLADTLYYDANSALHDGDKDGANAAFHECLALRKELANDPKDKILQAELMLAQARCGNHVEAARNAHALVATPPQDENLYVLAACGYALAAGAAAGDDGLVNTYTSNALDCLRKAKDKGWGVVVILKTDTDFEPIRNDPAFQAFVGELEQARKNDPAHGR